MNCCFISEPVSRQAREEWCFFLANFVKWIFINSQLTAKNVLPSCYVLTTILASVGEGYKKIQGKTTPPPMSQYLYIAKSLGNWWGVGWESTVVISNQRKYNTLFL